MGLALVLILCCVGLQVDRGGSNQVAGSERLPASEQAPLLKAVTFTKLGVTSSLRWRNAKIDDDRFSDPLHLLPSFNLRDGLSLPGKSLRRALLRSNADHPSELYSLPSPRAPPLA